MQPSGLFVVQQKGFCFGKGSDASHGLEQGRLCISFHFKFYFFP